MTKNPTGGGFSSEFVDLLDELRNSSDVGYALRAKNFPRYSGPYALPTARTPGQIMSDTLASVRVQAAIDSVSAERNWSRSAVEKEAGEIASEMGQCFDLKSVRPLAYLAKKVIPRLFSHIYVNRGGFERMKELSRRSAVIFMPSHRTYMDFILLQLLCFHYEINLPAIAAAVDFLNMKFMGEALRRCGAFFIRRQFGADELYWAVFTEYVEQQLKHADRPMEFFIEGTRSRTGKSLHPKYGLLSVLLEPYFRNEIYDFHLVPVSVSFGRILEESLYAYELLGFPKPKESTSGLWKARTVLNTDFGDVFVYAGEPISVRDYFTKLERPMANSIDRSVHALKPLVLFEYTPQEQTEIRRLGHRIVKINEANSVVRLWSLICVVLSGKLRRNVGGGAFHHQKDIELLYSDVLRDTEWLYEVVRRLNYKNVRLRSGTVKGDLEYYFNLHRNIAERIGGGERVRLNPVTISTVDAITTTSTTIRKLIDIAVPRIMISNYSNQAMHLFADISFVCLSYLKRNFGRGVSIIDREQILDDFRFLQTLFSREFISVPGEEVESFDRAVDRLIRASIFPADSSASSSPLSNRRRGSEIYKLASITESFLRGYLTFCDILLRTSSDQEGGAGLDEEKAIVTRIQKIVGEMLRDGVISNFELLSSDMAKNCLHSLKAMNAVKKRGRNYTILCEEVSGVRTRLRPFIAALDAAAAAGKDAIFFDGESGSGMLIEIRKSKL